WTQGGNQLVHFLVPLDACIGGLPYLAHGPKPHFAKSRTRRSDVFAGFPERLEQSDGILHGQAGSRTDGKVSSTQCVSHQHHVVEAPLFVPDYRKISPVRMVADN